MVESVGRRMRQRLARLCLPVPSGAAVPLPGTYLEEIGKKKKKKAQDGELRCQPVGSRLGRLRAEYRAGVEKGQCSLHVLVWSDYQEVFLRGKNPTTHTQWIKV